MSSGLAAEPGRPDWNFGVKSLTRWRSADAGNQSKGYAKHG